MAVLGLLSKPYMGLDGMSSLFTAINMTILKGKKTKNDSFLIKILHVE